MKELQQDMSLNIREYSEQDMGGFVENQNNDDLDYWSHLLRLDELKEQRLISVSIFDANGNAVITAAFVWEKKKFTTKFFYDPKIERNMNFESVLLKMARAVARKNEIQEFELDENGEKSLVQV